MLRPLLLTALLAAPAAGAELTFEEARKEMLAANPQARAAARNLEAARERLTAARAGLYPYFSASASYARSGSQGLAPGDSYSYGFSGTQPLFSPSLPAAVRSAKAAHFSAVAAYDGLVSRLGYDLKASFAGILNAREALKLSEATLKRREENLELIRLKYEAGRENKAALLETEAALKTARWRHERYKKELLLLERGLNRLLGRSPRAEVPGLALPGAPEPPADLSAFEAKLGEHPSLRSARASVDSARAAADTASAGRLPEASANGSYRWSGTDWPDRGSAWSLGASVNLPLFAGGRLSANVSAAGAALASAEAALKNSSDEVYLSAEDAFLSWREAYAWLDVAGSSLGAAEARAWLVRKQYLAGQTSYFEWRTVEDSLITVQNDYLSAGRALALAHAAFVRALGE
ncbi:MAG TPA: TolC family protein [Elusimicrobiales bacterium]|nr:TolC family protein [Elusimicrobiales bacterium]